MPTKRIRVEVFDEEGNRYTLAFEGQVTREKAVRLLDVVELLGGMSAASEVNRQNSDQMLVTKYDKTRTAVERFFPLVWFSSKELQNVFEQEFKEPMSLSTAATYLSRMCEKGVLIKSGLPNSFKYRLAQVPSEIKVKKQ